MYTLYGGLFTRAVIVEMVMAEGEIAYELRQVDILKQEHRGAAYRAINPAGLVPTLITPEGSQLYETPAISLYLAERHGLSHLAPPIEDPQRGPFLSGLFYLTDELEPDLKRYFFPERYSLCETDSDAMKAQALTLAHERFAVIEDRLAAGGPHYLGDRISLVDLTLAFWATCLPEQDLPKACPAILQNANLIAARPKLQAIFDGIMAWSDDYAKMQAEGRGVT